MQSPTIRKAICPARPGVCTGPMVARALKERQERGIRRTARHRTRPISSANNGLGRPALFYRPAGGTVKQCRTTNGPCRGPVRRTALRHRRSISPLPEGRSVCPRGWRISADWTEAARRGAAASALGPGEGRPERATRRRQSHGQRGRRRGRAAMAPPTTRPGTRIRTDTGAPEAGA